MKLKIILAATLLIGIGFFKCHSSSDKKENTTASGLPGDNLDLFAVMNFLEKSSGPKDFEKSLNDKSNHVNNLDLNGDGKVDYIRVIDNAEGIDHAFILRVPLNKNESQDVAVIEMEKRGNNKVNIELIGDKDLYGANYIVQPKNEKSSASFLLADVDVLVNVWYWPFVTTVYSPGYVVWVSPYSWNYYPDDWQEWEPLSYEMYVPYVEFYHPYYVEVRENYLSHSQRIFYANRVSGNFTYVRQVNEKNHFKNQNLHGAKTFDKPNEGNQRKINSSKIYKQPNASYQKVNSQKMNGRNKYNGGQDFEKPRENKNPDFRKPTGAGNFKGGVKKK